MKKCAICGDSEDKTPMSGKSKTEGKYICVNCWKNAEKLVKTSSAGFRYGSGMSDNFAECLNYYLSEPKKEKDNWGLLSL